MLSLPQIPCPHYPRFEACRRWTGTRTLRAGSRPAGAGQSAVMGGLRRWRRQRGMFRGRPWVPIRQEPAQLSCEALPSRLMRQNDVIGAVEPYKARIWDLARHQQTLLEWDASVMPPMHHQRRSRDPRQQLSDVDLAEHSRQADCVLCRDYHALQIGRGAWYEQRCEELVERRIVLSPANADGSDVCLSLGNFCDAAALEPPTRKSSKENEARDAVGVPYGIRDR